MIETNPFTTRSGEYLSTLISLWLPRHAWKIAVPLASLAAAGIIIPDERLLLVALMLLFIVIPMGMSFLYTYYMLTPEARRAILPKQVVIDEGRSLTLRYLPEEKPEEEKDDTPHFKIPDDEVIDWKDIRKVKYTSTAYVYVLNTPRLQFIIVPYLAVKK